MTDPNTIQALADAARELAEAARELRSGGRAQGTSSGPSAADQAKEIAAVVVALQGVTVLIGSAAAALSEAIPALAAFTDEIQAQTQSFRQAIGAFTAAMSATSDVTSQLAPFALAGIDVDESAIRQAARVATQRAVRVEGVRQEALEAVGSQLPGAYTREFANDGPTTVQTALRLLGFNAADPASGD